MVDLLPGLPAVESGWTMGSRVSPSVARETEHGYQGERDVQPRRVLHS